MEFSGCPSGAAGGRGSARRPVVWQRRADRDGRSANPSVAHVFWARDLLHSKGTQDNPAGFPFLAPGAEPFRVLSATGGLVIWDEKSRACDRAIFDAKWRGFWMVLRRRGGSFGAIAKWSKAMVCKTIIRGFKSRSHLHFSRPRLLTNPGAGPTLLDTPASP